MSNCIYVNSIIHCDIKLKACVCVCLCKQYLRLKVRRTPRRMMTNMRIPAMTPAIFTVLSTCFSGSMSLEFWVEAPLKQQVHHKEEKGHLTKTGTVEKGSTVTHKTNKQKNQIRRIKSEN